MTCCKTGKGVMPTDGIHPTRNWCVWDTHQAHDFWPLLHSLQLPMVQEQSLFQRLVQTYPPQLGGRGTALWTEMRSAVIYIVALTKLPSPPPRHACKCSKATGSHWFKQNCLPLSSCSQCFLLSSVNSAGSPSQKELALYNANSMCIADWAFRAWG